MGSKPTNPAIAKPRRPATADLSDPYAVSEFRRVVETFKAVDDAPLDHEVERWAQHVRSSIEVAFVKENPLSP